MIVEVCKFIPTVSRSKNKILFNGWLCSKCDTIAFESYFCGTDNMKFCPSCGSINRDYLNIFEKGIEYERV